ncbi:MAG: universal stress protein [Novosphingobium sp.]|nr:universal stress protein [Novosphingobium sp.]
MYQHILISTDGSDLARKGVDHGLALAKALGARTTLVTVAENRFRYVGAAAGMNADAFVEFAALQQAAAEKVLAEVGEEAARMGVAADAVCFETTLPAEAIVKTATERGCDLIVMSSHGRRGLRRMILGSVTSEVVAHSPVPVLVVR